MAFVRFLTDGKSAEVPDGSSLLDACDRHGCTLPFGCTEGFCGTCTMIVREGIENLSPPTEKERERLSDTGIREDKLRLACQCSILQGTIAFENG